MLIDNLLLGSSNYLLSDLLGHRHRLNNRLILKGDGVHRICSDYLLNCGRWQYCCYYILILVIVLRLKRGRSRCCVTLNERADIRSI